jgi:hypothetical protein
LAEFQKQYKTNAEYLLRRDIFENTLSFIDAENLNTNNTFTVGLTRFADWSKEEFKAIMSPIDVSSIKWVEAENKSDFNSSGRHLLA